MCLETRQFVEYSFKVGGMKTNGTDIDMLMPPMSRFGGGDRAEKKKNLIERLLTYFDRFLGIGAVTEEYEMLLEKPCRGGI